jgi:hypothetical protein
MVASAFTAPHVTEWVDVDVTRSMDLVASLRARPELEGVKVTPLTLVAAGLLRAVRAHPGINASFDAEAGEIVLLRGPWNEEFLQEAEIYPPGSAGHDDQVVAAAGGYSKASGHNTLLDFMDAELEGIAKGKAMAREAEVKSSVILVKKAPAKAMSADDVALRYELARMGWIVSDCSLNPNAAFSLVQAHVSPCVGCDLTCSKPKYDRK